MDCNKEEAIRSKDLAETKMQNKDFTGAKKALMKAQQLFPELENISQMLTVCEVHCCAAARIGDGKDWYKILQVEQSADESSIKKQYRKLALQLHPDKNKFAGAEAAFKLIGEANMTLSDRKKRYDYDSKRRQSGAMVPRQSSYQSTRPNFAKQHRGVPVKFANNAPPHFTNMHKQHPSAPPYFSNIHMQHQSASPHFSNVNMQHQSAFSVSGQSFWTACSACGHRYEYLRVLINRTVCCQGCKKFFNARELHAQSVPSAGASSSQYFCGTGTSSFNNVDHGNVGSAANNKQNDMAGNSVHFEKVNVDEGKKRKNQVNRSTPNAKRRKGRKHVSDSSDSATSTDGEDIPIDKETEVPAEVSAREKQKGTHNVSATGDDAVASDKGTDGEGVRKSNKDKIFVDLSDNDSPETALFSYPDPQFGNFEMEKDHSKFKVGQIWAAYDDIDAMPRYYARIKEVFAGGELHFNWLEHNATNGTEIAWTKAELPVACGNYRVGKMESEKSLDMFSHLMCWEKGPRRSTYNIFPMKGEVWALYKGWNLNWSSKVDRRRVYEYDVVEVISDFTDNRDVLVVHCLIKIEGFQSLFIRVMDKETYEIPSTELLRFSHKVPSYRLTGTEREVNLKGCLELDMASLPTNFAHTFPSISLDSVNSRVDKSDTAPTGPCSSGAAEKDDATCSMNLKEDKTADVIDYDKGDFHDFEEDKSIANIQPGQIWALYSDVDQYPNYYAKIRSVKNSAVSISWIEIFPQSDDEIAWSKKGLPCACGKFKLENKVEPPYDGTEAFSHMVQAASDEKDFYDIYPRSGEVWAIYKEWSIKWTKSDVKNCDYDVVEVLEQTESVIRVLALTKLDYRNMIIFKPEKEGEAMRTLEIPLGESLRFSHQIPAHRITDKQYEKLLGYWELHSMSVPRKFLLDSESLET